MKQAIKTDLSSVTTFDLKQRCHRLIEDIYTVPGCRKWFLYLTPILEGFAAYKQNRVGRFTKRAEPAVAVSSTLPLH